jgi:hypothetical protein
MLNSLDVLIGFAVVMLVVSMAVTMLTQVIGSSIMNLRGKSLHDGLSRLLALMDQGLTPEQARRIADYILRNPLVTSAGRRFGKYGLASTIHREELTKLLLDFAVPGDAAKADPQKHDDDASLRNALRASLRRNGIADPDAVLQKVRGAVVQMEKANPELSSSMRTSMALLEHASSPYLSKLNSWFDQTVDRTSELFTRRIRFVTAIVAVAVAFLVQLDSIALINQLSVDDKLRASLVDTAIQKQNVYREQLAAVPAADGSVKPDIPSLTQAQRDVDSLGIVAMPTSIAQWNQAWWQSNADGGAFRWAFLFGVLLSAALLSLGAPFWYSALANLLKLRSLISQKDEVQRTERQTTQAPGTLPLPDAAALSGTGTGVSPTTSLPAPTEEEQGEGVADGEEPAEADSADGGGDGEPNTGA